MNPTDTWNPEVYNRFEKERQQPFIDLKSLVRVKPGMRVADLGCGTGRLTRVLHERLNAAMTVGFDSISMRTDIHCIWKRRRNHESRK